MYKLPADFDGQFFLGKTLEYITFAEYSMVFSFEDDIGVTVESSLQHVMDGDGGIIQSMPFSETKLMQLVGHAVSQVRTDTDGVLEIFFDHGQSLRIFDDYPTNYDSYTIRHGEIEIFV